MIPFQCRLRDSTRTPIIKNEEIWEYAESLIGDYKPALLKEPAPLNAAHFLESFLGATLDYQDIYFEKGESPIAGATVFNDENIRVFDRDGRCTKIIPVPAGTIIIDNSTVTSKYKGYETFTALHEGGHFAMHGEVYRRDPNQISLFDGLKDGTGVVCCRKDAMFGYYSENRRLTPAQNREHQANTFAAFTAMPRQTFVPFAQSLIIDAGFEDGVFIEDDCDWESNLAMDNLCNKLAETYGTSYTASKIHLKELGLVISIHAYRRMKAQTAVTF